MKYSLLAMTLLALLALGVGCVTKGEANARAREAFLAGQQQGMARRAGAAGPVVVINGPVQSPTLPWSPDLTLAKAIVAAGYRGNDPTSIVISRNGQDIAVDPKRLLAGEDLPLFAGDAIEIH